AEDGIRDFHVTGVQTCALPILKCRNLLLLACAIDYRPSPMHRGPLDWQQSDQAPDHHHTDKGAQKGNNYHLLDFVQSYIYPYWCRMQDLLRPKLSLRYLVDVF